MNPRTFLQEFSESAERDRLVEAVYDEFMVYAREQGITENDLSTAELEDLAEAVVDRGLGFEAELDRTEWQAEHGLRHTLGFERVNPGTQGNVYRFATRDFGEGGWRYIDAEPGLEVMYLQNRL